MSLTDIAMVYLFLTSSDHFDILRVGVGGYCCTLSQAMTHKHTLSRTPLDERSACRRHLYHTTHNTHKRETSMLPAVYRAAFGVGVQCSLH